jgi:hypothetical protein
VRGVVPATEARGVKTTGRKQGTKFRPGQSGNPAGRPKGSKNRSTALWAALLEDGGEEVLRRVVERARRGDPLCVRLVVERLLPRATPTHSVELDLPRMQRAGDIVSALATVLGSVAAGEMTLEEAGQFARILEGQRRAIETADLAVRVDALERGEEEPGR